MQSLVTTLSHPWDWAAHERASAPAQETSRRWKQRKDLSFIPLRPERVVEVRYDYMEGIRFRHTAQFERWRPTGSRLHVRAAERPVQFKPRRVLTSR